ncbi:hypothetical protein [Streptomyces sp. S1]|uniref:hypothetical protein n=1 Tax=Streptomyces sp. S1 TaxID=718288 RepID=UPI003D72884B
MNARYRKAMRLKSRHARRGHTPWCRCPELWQGFALALQRKCREDFGGDWKLFWASFPVHRLPPRKERS